MNIELKKCLDVDEKNVEISEEDVVGFSKKDIGLIHKYSDSGNPFIYLNDNKPDFTKAEIIEGLEKILEPFSDLDELNRCGRAFDCIGGKNLENIDKSKRNIRIKPTAWKSINCKDINDGGYLYNRCHLIGRQLTAKKANRKGLITGTRNFNIGMSKFEDKVASYIKKKQNRHILYRVTPYFEGKNLLACGVKMEAFSIEDNGRGISYNVFVYNRQPGFNIDYKTGEVYSDNCMFIEGKLKSWNVYIINMDTKRFRIKPCVTTCNNKSTSDCNIRGTNEMFFAGKIQTLIENGYSES